MTTSAFRNRDLIVSTNSAQYARVAGYDTYPDSLDIIDATDYSPRIVASVVVDTSIVDPSQTVVVSPNQRLAIVGETSGFERVSQQIVLENTIQIVDLEAQTPCLPNTVDRGHHPHGLATNHAGDLLSVACTDDTLVTLRDDQGVAVLDIADGKVASTPCRRINSGIAPCAIEISVNGKWAIVGNAGPVGLNPAPGLICRNRDSATSIGLTQRTFLAVQHFTVPSIPEGMAISQELDPTNPDALSIDSLINLVAKPLQPLMLIPR